jgi:membrane-bound inhibitor of C-type lysozyme
MNKNNVLVAVVVLLVLVALGYWTWMRMKPAPDPSSAIAAASYACDSGKTITASFSEGTTSIAAIPGQPPVPTGSVMLTLSDGRTMTLPQTLSADGGRYANADESIIFWDKGVGSFLKEGNAETYANCMPTPSQG